MKKYKLIKEYPASPELNTIVTELPHGIALYQDVFFRRFHKDNIENYPEFWELVVEPTKVEKDYEILSFMYKDKSLCIKDNLCFIDLLDNIEGKTPKYWNPALANAVIHSIKRLSDGEVFTIGDNVNYRQNQYKIVRFHISDTNASNKIVVTLDWTLKTGQHYDYELQSIQHIKQPLFKTEDDVDIFHSDEYYTIFDDKHKACPSNVKIFDINGPFFGIDDNEPYDRDVKYFSTKKAAEEWIIYNKPCLSAKDVLKYIYEQKPSVYDNPDKYTKMNNFEGLKQLIKEKLHKS